MLSDKGGIHTGTRSMASKSTSTLFDPNLTPNPSLTGLRYLLILFACLVIGSTLLRIIDTLGFRHRRSSENRNRRWRSSRCFVGTYRVRNGNGRLDVLNVSTKRARRWIEGYGDEENIAEGSIAVGPDVKDTCVQT